MCKGKRWFFVGLLSALILMLIGWGEQVQSQEKYPTRPIQIICPFAAGASVDVVARLAADYLNKKWGVPVNVINKPGGNTLPACMELYSAAPNGYTMLLDGQASSSTLGVVVKDLPFRIMDRTLIAMVSGINQIFVVPVTSPHKSLEDVIAEVKRDPDNFTWGSLGGASGTDFMMRQFFKAIGVDIMKTKPVMFKGGALAVAAAAGGHIKLGAASIIGARAAVQANTIRILGIANKRDPEFPDIPTFAELGYPTINIFYWHGFSGPPKVPSYIVDIWEKALQKMVSDPGFVSRLANVGIIPKYLNSREVKDYIMKEMEEVAELYDIKK